MAKKKGSSKGAKALYTRYKAENREDKNRARKLARHMKNHPNDAQTVSSIDKKAVHRKKPAGKKVFYKLSGIQQVSEGVFSYISHEVYKPGHPALALAKQGYAFEQAKKLKNSAIFSEEFKLTYPRYAN